MVHPAEAALHAGRPRKAEVRQESLVGMRGLLQHPEVMWVGAEKQHAERPKACRLLCSISVMAQ